MAKAKWIFYGWKESELNLAEVKPKGEALLVNGRGQMDLLWWRGVWAESKMGQAQRRSVAG